MSHCLRDGCPADRLCGMLHALLNTHMDRDLCLRAWATYMRAHNEHTGRQSGGRLTGTLGQRREKGSGGSEGLGKLREKYQVVFFIFFGLFFIWRTSMNSLHVRLVKAPIWSIF